MEIVIIGTLGCCENLLIIETLKDIESVCCVEKNTKDLIQMKKEIEDNILLEYKDIKLFDNSMHRKKGKEKKSWEKNRFYQK